MSTYFLLLSLTAEGRNMMHEEPELVLHSAHSSELPDVQCMGLYAVLGEYDFITILEAPDNEAAARFSIELGVKAGVQVETIPAIPVSRLDHRMPDYSPEEDISSYNDSDDADG